MQKWWSSGAGDPRCKLYLVMGKTDPKNSNPYKQQSVIIVPAGHPGVTVQRALSVYGYDGKSIPYSSQMINTDPDTWPYP